MKVLKNTIQRNVLLNKDYYTQSDILNMLENKEICYFDSNMNHCYTVERVSTIWDINFRLFLSDLKELKVVYDKEIGMYSTVAIGNNDKKYYVLV